MALPSRNGKTEDATCYRVEFAWLCNTSTHVYRGNSRHAWLVSPMLSGLIFPGGKIRYKGLLIVYRVRSFSCPGSIPVFGVFFPRTNVRPGKDKRHTTGSTQGS